MLTLATSMLIASGKDYRLYVYNSAKSLDVYLLAVNLSNESFLCPPAVFSCRDWFNAIDRLSDSVLSICKHRNAFILFVFFHIDFFLTRSPPANASLGKDDQKGKPSCRSKKSSDSIHIAVYSYCPFHTFKLSD